MFVAWLSVTEGRCACILYDATFKIIVCNPRI